MSINTRAFNTYLFLGPQESRVKKGNICWESVHTVSHKYTQALPGLGSERPSRVNPPHIEASLSRTGKKKKQKNPLGREPGNVSLS